MKRWRGALLALVAVLVAAAAQFYLVTRAEADEDGRRLLYLPNGRFLKVASLGYPTFLADMIYLWSIQFYGDYEAKGDRFAYMEHVYSEVIARLDPRFVDPYLVGALIMAVEKQDVEAALTLLDQGIEANPGNWLMPYVAGFWAYDTARDYERAAAYFYRAKQIPGAPQSTHRLYADMLNRGGDKETSLSLWREVLDTAVEESVRAIAANHVHDLQVEVDLLHIRQAVDGFQAATGRFPVSLTEMVDAGQLASVPLDPDGKPYLVDAKTGEAYSTTPFRLRRR